MKVDGESSDRKKRFCVAIYGSARIEKRDTNWTLVYSLAKRIAEEGMDIVTGGGPGLMDAASKGHYAGDIGNKSDSIGLQIKMPKEQRDALHLDIKKEFHSFSKRLDSFIELANIVVVAPGGVGTLLELLYTWQLLQVEMISDVPIILIGEMWSHFIRWVKEWPLNSHFLDKEDLNLLFLAKDSGSAFDVIKKKQMEFKERNN